MTTVSDAATSASATASDGPEADSAERTLRHTKVRAAMAENGLDAVLAYGPGWRRENVRYFADARVTGSSSFVLFPASGEVAAFS